MRRLREVYRSAGWPCLDTIEVDLLAAGLLQRDAIRAPDGSWQDTLRVTTIPTQSGTFGNDGDFVFSVRQSRLGVRGAYGDEVLAAL